MFILSACGGSEASAEPSVPDASDVATVDTTTDEPDPSEAPASTERDARDIMVDFTGCLRDEGFEVPDPDFSQSVAETQAGLAAAGIDTNSPAFNDAVAACEPILVGILQEISTEDLTAWADATVNYSECMRENGIEIPDPDFTQGFSGLFGSAELDTDDPNFARADAICQAAFESLPNIFGES
jgi:hypothetical protein